MPLQQTTTAVDGSGGRAAQGLAVDRANKRVFSQNFMSRSVTVFDGKADDTVRSSTDLQSWDVVDPASIEPVERVDGIWQMRIEDSSLSGERRFFRLEVISSD